MFQADFRYSGQATTVPIDVHLEVLETKGLSSLHEQFDAEHRKLFTYSLNTEVEIVNLRVIAEEANVDLPVKQLTKAERLSPPRSCAPVKTKLVFDGREHHDCLIWERSSLLDGHTLYGPCVITEMDANTLVHPGFVAEVDAVGNLLIWENVDQGHPAPMATDQQLDVVTVDIFENALRNARNEMDALMTRTTMSPAIREQQDEFNVIAEPGGKMLVGQFGSFIGGFLEEWKDTIEPGDIFLTNDPYSVAGSYFHGPSFLSFCIGVSNIAMGAV